jgi:trans-AT polyketide synthase/acyltransferase/oxidoreductase domain-containing protein
MSVAYVFPGQGSQKKGMGEGLFERFPALVSAADAELGYSLRELCLADPEGFLGQTQYTQPALYAVNALSYLARSQADGRPPDFVAGHSLGEYNALFAAEAFDFLTGLRLVRRRGALMAEVRGGAMAAIIGISGEQVGELLHNFAFDRVERANFNSPTQTVISGPADDVAAVSPLFEQTGAVVIRLKVSGAFHSRMMEPVGRQFRQFLDGFTFGDLKIPVIANLSGRPYDPAAIKDTLAAQITQPVRWTESVRYLTGMGNPTFVEVGPGTVLAGLIRQIQKAPA